MMLSMRMAEARRLAAELPSARRAAGTAELANTRHAPLAGLSRKWAPFFAIYRGFRERGICAKFTLKHAFVCQGALEEMRVALDTPLAEPGSQRLFFESYAPEFAKQFEERLKMAWATHIRNSLEQTCGDVVATDHRFEQPSIVQQIATLTHAIQQMGEALPNETRVEATLDALEERLIQLRDMYALLPQEVPPLEVRQFLVAVRGPGGAPLELYTPAVAAWIMERGMVTRMKVHIG